MQFTNQTEIQIREEGFDELDGDPTQSSILVVDDRAANREFLSTLLSYFGYRVLQAADGAEALEVLQKERADLIITDILMPTMDGGELVIRLQSHPILAGIPVIFCSASYREPQARQLAAAHGVPFVLSKPADPNLILDTVKRALGGQAHPFLRDPARIPEREYVARTTEELQRYAMKPEAVSTRLAALIEFGMDLSLAQDTPALLYRLCHAARRIVGGRFAVVGILDSNQEMLQHFFTAGIDTEAATRIHAIPPRAGVLGRLLRQRRACRERDLNGDPEILGFPPTFPAIQSFLAAPIATSSSVYGWLYLADSLGGPGFTDEDERLATTLAAQAAVAYENASRYQAVRARTEALEREVQVRTRAEEDARERAGLSHFVSDVTVALTESETLPRMLQRCAEEMVRHLDAALARIWLLREDIQTLELSASAGIYTHLDGADSRIPLGRFNVGRIAAERRAHLTNDAQSDPGIGDPEWAKREGLVGFAGYPLVVEERLIGVMALFSRQTLSDSTIHAMEHVAKGVALGIGRKRTEQALRQSEAQLRQAQKMEAVGRLAGGIAHDFNNLLTVIAGYSELVLTEIDETSPVCDDVREIRHAVGRASALTRQLLVFSRKQVVEPRVLDLNSLVSNVEKMLQRVIGEDITLVTALEQGLGSVKADPTHMEQILLNLAVNSRDAMPRGGKLTIETANVDLGEDYAGTHPDVRPGPYVRFAVSDTGVGMDSETQSKIFEPFFTTKGPDKGTGLGLTVVYGIVKQWEGHIGVYSEPGKGTTFKIYLPRADQTSVTSTTQSPAPKDLRGNETILLVEDEDHVGSLAHRVLSQYGYRVLRAHNGTEALHIAEQYPEPIHLLLTDVVMPGSSGPETAERLGALRRDLKVLYMSGYSEHVVLEHRILQAGSAYLEKPFTPHALALKLREALDRT